MTEREAYRSWAGYMAALFVAAVLQTGCEHKDIICCDSSPRMLDIKFEWVKAPDARPEGMTVYFFPDDRQSKLWRFDIRGRDGGKIELPPGAYRMLAFNNDLPGVRFDISAGFDDFKAMAVSTAPDKVAPTGMLYSAAVGYLEVTMCGVEYLDAEGRMKNCPYGIVRCEPDSVSTVYTAILRDVKGMERLRSASAALIGIAPEIRLADRQTAGAPVGTAFSLTRTDTGLTGTTTGFGTPPGKPQVILQVLVTRTDGAVLSKKYDATEQVMNYRYKRYVIIIIDNMEIPEGDVPPGPSDPDIGIDVDIDSWTVVNIDIPGDLP